MHARSIETARGPDALKAGHTQGAVLVASVICAPLAPALIGPVLPQIARHFAGTPHIDLLVPVVMTMPMLTVGIFGTWIGSLTDRAGRKPVLILALALYALAGMAPLRLDSIYSVIGSRAVVGLAEAGVMAVSTALIGDYFVAAMRDRYASLQTTVAAVTALIFNVAAGVLGTYGWRAPFIAYAIPVAIIPFAFFFIHDVRRPVRASVLSSNETATQANIPPAVLVSICASAFALGLAFMVVPTNLSFLLSGLGSVSPGQIGLSYASNSAGIVIGTLTYGWIFARKTAVRQQALMGGFTAACGFLALGAARDFSLATLGGALNGLGLGLLLPALTSWTLGVLPERQRGKGTGALFASQFLGYFFSPLITTTMLARLGNRADVALLAGAATLLICAALAMRSWFMKNDPSKQPH